MTKFNPDDVFTLELLDQAVARMKLIEPRLDSQVFFFPYGPWTCTLCGSIQSVREETCQGCGKEELARELRLTGEEDGQA